MSVTTHAGQPLLRLCQTFASGPPREQQRQRDVLDRWQLRYQLSELVDQAEGGSAQFHALTIGDPVDALAREVDLARIGSQHSGETMQERRLAGSARTHHRHDLALVDGDAGAAQRGREAVRLVQLKPE